MNLRPLSMFVSTILTLLIITPTLSNTHIQQLNTCISPEGKSVDWSIIYTLPRSSTGEKMKFNYIDNTMKEFKLYDAIESKFPPLKIALELNNNKEDNTYIIWNDDPTNGDDKPKYDESYAHSKGLLSFDSKNGVYIIHSLPRFPFRDADGIILNKFSSNFGIFGQTFFCMSVDFSQTIHILDALLSIRPQVLLHNISTDHGKHALIYNKIERLVDLKTNIKTKDHFEIKTKEGLEIKLFVENTHGYLPWDTSIPHYYKDSFYVETWTRPSLLPNICKSHKGVYNMVDISMNGYKYRNTDDHSKWGVSVNHKVVCYGDLNRTNRSSGEKDRLGSIACFEHGQVADLVKGFVKDYERCDKLKFLD